MKLFSWKKKPEPPKTDMNINVFFKAFILDTLKELPTEKSDLIGNMNLDNVFSTDFNDWKKTIKKVLNLSDTIEIAIKDLWLRNSEIAKNDGTELNADKFSDLFIENYYVENSKVVIWESESDLNNAKKRIAESNLAV
ncbi:hypothetical protein BWZ20_00600 [Winogradskyella sp. J14-2]|uniref:hypothetical protein n=1 Tax=Winogradskyella sp. J14-2 TaxID=1936080 RepID=UPI00097294A2|nr:hypothetical protein [Winogradskyella sp. J14-2]APY06848.1 hypothetical protein BWZ20_00405 [Winogradskyella sp. J14-2]APY06886.1 hypothetical protein BWZ20_00600 [Winogradskyella sp. J14-2]